MGTYPYAEWEKNAINNSIQTFTRSQWDSTVERFPNTYKEIIKF